MKEDVPQEMYKVAEDLIKVDDVEVEALELIRKGLNKLGQRKDFNNDVLDAVRSQNLDAENAAKAHAGNLEDEAIAAFQKAAKNLGTIDQVTDDAAENVVKSITEIENRPSPAFIKTYVKSMGILTIVAPLAVIGSIFGIPYVLSKFKPSEPEKYVRNYPSGKDYHFDYDIGGVWKAPEDKIGDPTEMRLIIPSKNLGGKDEVVVYSKSSNKKDLEYIMEKVQTNQFEKNGKKGTSYLHADVLAEVVSALPYADSDDKDFTTVTDKDVAKLKNIISTGGSVDDIVSFRKNYKPISEKKD